MKNLVILVSGSGSNMQRIIECVQSGEIPNAKINMVIADRECYAIERAKNAAIPTHLIPRGNSFSDQLLKLIPCDTDLIILAGFLSILRSEFIEKFQGKIINIHPALLPKFGGKGMWGKYVHQAVLDKGEVQSGATVHFVTSGIDEGDIILQKKIDIDANENMESLTAKIHQIEHEIYPLAINKILNGNQQ